MQTRTRRCPKPGRSLRRAQRRAWKRLSLTDFLRWSLDTFGAGSRTSPALGRAACVILDHLLRLKPDRARDHARHAVSLRRDLRVVGRASSGATASASKWCGPHFRPRSRQRQFGPNLWELEPDICCDCARCSRWPRRWPGWTPGTPASAATSLRTRADTPLVAWDSAIDLFKLSPLASWTRQQVWAYIRDHDVPYNRLHDQGYTSIGCTHCTRPPGSAGRRTFGPLGRPAEDRVRPALGAAAARGGLPGMKTYPINLVLHDRLVRARSAPRAKSPTRSPPLLEVGARVRVIAPVSRCLRLRSSPPRARSSGCAARYQPGDLAGAALVFAATRDPQVHDADLG